MVVLTSLVSQLRELGHRKVSSLAQCHSASPAPLSTLLIPAVSCPCSAAYGLFFCSVTSSPTWISGPCGWTLSWKCCCVSSSFIRVLSLQKVWWINRWNKNQFIPLKGRPGAGEITRWVKHLLCKPKDQSSDSQNASKSRMENDKNALSICMKLSDNNKEAEKRGQNDERSRDGEISPLTQRIKSSSRERKISLPQIPAARLVQCPSTKETEIRNPQSKLASEITQRRQLWVQRKTLPR